MSVRIVVGHGWYGCETGCCGHRVTVFVDGEERGSAFTFDHSGGLHTPEDPLAFARHVAEAEFPARVREGAEIVEDADNPISPRATCGG